MGGYKKAAGIMKALGHPVRLQILDELRREEEACVCHLEAHLGLRQAYISQQLARLRDAGLVTDRRDGLNVYYSLAEAALESLLDAARSTAAALARHDKQNLVFPAIARAADCPCPRCEEEMKSRVA